MCVDDIFQHQFPVKKYCYWWCVIWLDGSAHREDTLREENWKCWKSGRCLYPKKFFGLPLAQIVMRKSKLGQWWYLTFGTVVFFVCFRLNYNLCKKIELINQTGMFRANIISLKTYIFLLNYFAIFLRKFLIWNFFAILAARKLSTAFFKAFLFDKITRWFW